MVAALAARVHCARSRRASRAASTKGKQQMSEEELVNIEFELDKQRELRISIIAGHMGAFKARMEDVARVEAQARQLVKAAASLRRVLEGRVKPEYLASALGGFNYEALQTLAGVAPLLTDLAREEQCAAMDHPLRAAVRNAKERSEHGKATHG